MASFTNYTRNWILDAAYQSGSQSTREPNRDGRGRLIPDHPAQRSAEWPSPPSPSYTDLGGLSGPIDSLAQAMAVARLEQELAQEKVRASRLDIELRAAGARLAEQASDVSFFSCNIIFYIFTTLCYIQQNIICNIIF